MGKDPIPVARKIAKFVIKTRFADMQPDVVNKTKRLVLDQIGCIVGARGLPSSEMITEMASEFGKNDESTVLGYGLKTSCTAAALANATMGHSLEMDDLHREATIHPAVTVIPAALALGEKYRIPGEKLIEAVAVGYETALRLGKGFLGKLYFQNFHPTGVCGVFGAAAASSKVMNLSEDEIINSLGIAGSQASGLREARAAGTWGKRFQAGHASMCGVLSSVLAKKGFTGPETIFEGDSGFYKAYAHKGIYDLNKIDEELGWKWELLNVAFKLHACCRFCAPVIDAVLQAKKENEIKAEEVDRIWVGTYQASLDAITKPEERKYRPQTIVDAQFSLPYCAALAISKGRAFVQEFTEESIQDRRVLDVASRIKWGLDEEAEQKYPQCFSAIVKIQTKSGKELQARVDHAKGDIENPVSDSELVSKFKGLSEGVLGEQKCEKVKSAVFSLEKMADICALTASLR